MCYMSIIIFFLQSDEAHWWRVCYQRGLPRLVVMESSFDEQKTEEEIGNKTIQSFIISILSSASLYKKVKKVEEDSARHQLCVARHIEEVKHIEKLPNFLRYIGKLYSSCALRGGVQKNTLYSKSG